jgi:hypothetical protein
LNPFPDSVIAFRQVFPDDAARAGGMALARWIESFERPGSGQRRVGRGDAREDHHPRHACAAEPKSESDFPPWTVAGASDRDRTPHGTVRSFKRRQSPGSL